MKSLITIAILIAFLVVNFSCKSSKFKKKLPFKIEKGFYQNWTGGQPGVGGIRFEFIISDLSENVEFKNIYFKNNKEQLYLRKSDNNNVVTANISKENADRINLIMHIDATKEFNNTLPNTSDFPFKLKNNECVISYLESDIENFYKLVLTKEKDVFYP